MCLWMLLWPFLEDLSRSIAVKSGRNMAEPSANYGGFILAVWIIGTALLYPYRP